MKTRTDLLNHLVDKYHLKRYLEIGVQNPIQNFDKINCEVKFSVDPDPNAHASFCMTSDDFFKIADREFDLVFIDGLHTAEQVRKDFENSLRILSPNGFIVLHDCNPEKEEHTIVPRPTKTGHWNGDVYKFASSIPKYPFCTIDIDNGCLVCKPEHDFFRDDIDWLKYIDWNFFNENRKELLNLISWDDFVCQEKLLQS